MIQQIEEDTGDLPPSLPRGVPPEVAAANADVQAIIVPRLTMLMEIANTFLATIIDGMETVPYGIRWICKQIRSLTRVRSSFWYWKSTGWCDRGNTQKLPMLLSVHWLVDSSFYDSSILPLLLRRHTCWWMVYLRNTLEGRLPLWATLASNMETELIVRLQRCCRTWRTNLHMPKNSIWWVWIHSWKTTRLGWISSWTLYAKLGISTSHSRYVFVHLVRADR